MSAAPEILALVTEAFGGVGGIAQYNRDLLSALASSDAKISITVLPRSAPRKALVPLQNIRQLASRRGWLKYALGALRTALSKRVAIVFCGHLYMAPLGAFLARLKGAKLVIQTHGIEAWPKPSRMRRRALEAADLVLCVSRFTRSAILDWAAIAPERVAVLPNTVGEAFTPGTSPLRAALGLENRSVLLSVGRMDSRERYKGQDRVIRALPALRAAGHDVAYVVIGEGDDIKRLQALAEQEDVAERVIFLGAVREETLVEAYRMADLFVMPSTGEGFGIAFLEAMASGTRALGLATAGARDALADGELGQMASESEFPRTLAQALAEPSTSRRVLAEKVRSRFGRLNFSSRVSVIFHTFLQPA